MALRDPSTVLGPRVRARRDALGWSQARLAESVGASTNFVGMVERGETLPSIPMLFKLAKALAIDPGMLVGGISPEMTAWQSELHAVAANVPAAHRGLVIDLLRAVITHAGRAKRGARR